MARVTLVPTGTAMLSYHGQHERPVFALLSAIVLLSETLVGTVLEKRYRVLERLGTGGMGTVFLAEQVTLRRKLAVKVLKEEYSTEPEFVARFMREARAASAIQHPNVVEIVDTGTLPNGSAYYVMEYLEGEDLAKTLKRVGRLPWSRVRAIALQICDALGAIHKAGVVHRDLKPGNCLLLIQGIDRIKVLDFGVAKLLEHQGGALTGTGEMLGTAQYMAPEQAAGDRIDHRVDIYALGVMIYQFLTGVHPYAGRTSVETLYALLHRTPQTLQEVAPEANLPDKLQEVVARAMHRDYTQRYTSMRDLADALLSIDVPGSSESSPSGAANTIADRRSGTNELSVGGMLAPTDLVSTPEADTPLNAPIADLSKAQPETKTATRHSLREWLPLALVVSGVLAISVAMLSQHHSAGPEAIRCSSAEQRLAEVWNDGRAGAVEASLTATGLGYARNTAPKIRANLDLYARNWRDAHGLVCDATFVDNTQPLQYLRPRLECLDDQLADMNTMVDILAKADSNVAENSVYAVSQLLTPEHCTKTSEEHLPTENVDSVHHVREILSRVRIVNNVGNNSHALESAHVAEEQAKGINFVPLHAEVQLQLGIVEMSNRLPDHASMSITKAYNLAEESGSDSVRVAAATHLIAMTNMLGREDEALMWGRIASAAIQRLANPPQLKFELHYNLALVHLQFARYNDARHNLELAIENDVYAPGYRLGNYHKRLGFVYFMHGSYQEAKSEFVQAIELGESSLGSGHPGLAGAIENRGWTHIKLGDLAAAEIDFHDSIAITEAAFGAQDPRVGVYLDGLGTLALYNGDYAGAAAIYRRARELFGWADHRSSFPVTTNLVEAAFRSGDLAEANRLGQQVLEACEKTGGRDHDRVAHILSHLGRIQLLEGKFDAADTLITRGVELLERTQGPDFPDLARLLVSRGLLELARARPALAIAPLERALVLARKAWEPPYEHAELRRAFADALWITAQDRRRAHELMLEAQSRLQEAPPTPTRTQWLGDIDGWLAAHPAI